MKCRTIFKEIIFMIGKMSSSFLVALLCTFSAAVFAAKPHHITIALSNISEAISWYEEHLDCQAIPGRDDTVNCGNTEIEFFLGRTVGGSQGTGVDRICLLYTSPSPRDRQKSRMPSSA